MLSLLSRKDSITTIVAIGLTILCGCSKTGIQSTVNHGAVSGTVRDSYTEHPIPGAVVTIGDTSTVAGEDGSFELYNVPEGLLQIHVQGRGYEDFQDRLLVGANTRFHALLDSLGRFAHLSGRVFLGESEIALSGVRVDVEIRTTQSDSLGYYRFDSLPSGTYALCASLYNHSTCRAAQTYKGETVVDLRLADTRLDGRVYHSVDGPVAGVRIEIAQVSTTTGEDGRYELPHVPLGAHTIRFIHPDYLTAEREVSLQSKGSTLDMRIRRVMVDTLLLTDDATIARHNFDGCHDCPEWPDPGAGYGLKPTLLAAYYLMPDTAAPGGSWNGLARSVVRLPQMPEHIPRDGFLSAKLRLHPAESSHDRGDVVLRRVRPTLPWSETSMVWQDQPATDLIPVAVYSPTDLSRLSYDVTSYYAADPQANPSFVVQNEESGATIEPRVMRFHSRQSELVEKRPVVLFEYID